MGKGGCVRFNTKTTMHENAKLVDAVYNDDLGMTPSNMWMLRFVARYLGLSWQNLGIGRNYNG